LVSRFEGRIMIRPGVAADEPITEQIELMTIEEVCALWRDEA
jgi:hypothetical protein